MTSCLRAALAVVAATAAVLLPAAWLYLAVNQ